MTSHAGATGEHGPKAAGVWGDEEASGESTYGGWERAADALRLEVSAWPRSADPEREGRSVQVETLVARPASTRRRAHRHTHSMDSRERDRGNPRERDRDREEERESVESVRVGENGRERQRQKKTERKDRDRERPRDREGRRGTQSLFNSSSDIHQTGAMEGGEGSNRSQRGRPSPRPHDTGYSLTTTTSTNAISFSPRPAMGSMSPVLHRPPIRRRSTPLSPQRASHRTGAGELRHCAPYTSREQDPFWVEVRTGAGFGRPSQSHRARTRRASHTGSELGEEEEEEEGGVEGEEEEEELDEGEALESRGVMEVMTQTLTSVAPPSSASLGQRRMSKREKNRMKSLRRRQRRRERWRQNQLLENRQVNNAEHSLHL